MEAKRTDRRVLRTLRMIDDALLELLEEKPIGEIGVTQLCERADINRNTFYSHYGTPQDVLNHLEEKILSQIGSALSPSSDSVEATETTLRVLKENSRLAKVLLSDHVDGHFSDTLFQATTSRSLQIASRQASRLSHEYQLLLADFSNAGGAAIVRRWALNGMQEPPEDIARFIRIVSNYGSHGVQDQPDPQFY